ncbi:erythromycin esterase family protein [Hymenobacter psychrophilus]|uniref:Erythromycin esterase n=1 Tax=Hymenobacter psychrophilus TaxID=651662 RepID=A0A1H3BFS4_9BACT|nr:erythromycin esterase family protein [Hymenobacter psychrophilus]SDX40635.1 erythromycin esterase [Hymenobacter psychrophilus]
MLLSKINQRLALLLLLLYPLLAPAQAHLNLALEANANRGRPLLLWARKMDGGTVVNFDTATFRQGRGSLRLDLEKADEPTSAAIYTLFSFPVDSVRGRLVTVSGWVRTRGFAGQAGLYAYAHTPDNDDGKDRRDQLENLPPNQEWRRLELTLVVKPTATAFGLGVRAYGSGQVWFDDVEVRINGRRYQDGPLAGTEALLLTAQERQTPAWSFEQLPPPAARPDPTRVTLRLDSLLPRQGRHSLRLTAAPPARPGEAVPVVYLGTLPIAQLRGKMLRVSGYWRQPAPAGAGAPALPVFTYARLSTDGRGGTESQWSHGVVELPPPPRPGAEWAAFSLRIPVADDEFATDLSLGMRLPGPATVLLDDFTFSLDGQPYVPALPPAPAPAAPTTAEVAWLRRVLVPLPVSAPAAGAASKTPDLAALGPLIGNARVVGLGEVTHGSGSLFEMKHRLVRYLVEQKGFTGFVLESSADCEPLNQYLQTGQGDPARLVGSLGVFSTQEVLDLLRYLRAYNQRPGVAKVQFAGMDMQAPENALAFLQQAARPDDEFVQTRLRELAAALAQVPRSGGGPALDLFQTPHQPTDARLQTLLRLIRELRTGLDTRFKLVRNPDWTARQQARFLFELRRLEQGATFRRLPLRQGGDYRDACMAENVLWLSQNLGLNGTPTKLAVWAHNAHVATSALSQRPLGEWLRASFGPSYLSLGFAFGQGSYAAESGHTFRSVAAQPAPAGSYEAWFQATKLPAFVLDMRRLKLNDENAWLFQQQQFRDIGIQEAPQNFASHELHSEFDAVLFLQESKAAQHLK